MENIYIGTICKYEGMEKTDLSIRYIIDQKDLRKIKCIKENDEIIDIDTNKHYHLVAKLSNGTIDPTEKIELNKEYIIDLIPYRKSLMTQKGVTMDYLKAIRTRTLINNEKRLTKCKVKKAIKQQ